MSQPIEFVPDWAKGIVWYQIFPERFWNGDQGNDPRLVDQLHSWPHNQHSPYQIHPWTAEWYKRQPYEQGNDLNIWQTFHRRRYGGDIQGIFDRLDYLEELGVGAIYLNPVFMAASEHKYDGATYHHIDPTFGPDPDGDRALIATETPHDPSTWVWTSADRLMLDLIAEVHRRGMRIIFDGVFNHFGLSSWVYQDVAKNQQASPYRDWLRINSWDDADAGTQFEYVGWFGVVELPETNQDENGLVAGPKQYVFDCTRRWMDPHGNGDCSAGIDGWRLDVAFCIEHPFWKEWRTHVRSINSEAYLTAEVIRPIETTLPYVEGDEFDAVMNYNFAWAVSEWMIQQNVRISTAEFDQRLHEMITAYPDGVAYVMQNLYGSHDTARLASHIVNRDRLDYRKWESYHPAAKAEHNAAFDMRGPTAAEKALQKLFVALQMTYVGAPMVYYGDEVGMWGANDPCCRQPMVWPELTYEPHTVYRDQLPFAEPQPVAFDHDLHAWYRKLIRIHNASAALRSGDFQTLVVDADVYAFARQSADERAVVVLNRSEQPQSVTVPLADGNYTDQISGATFAVNGGSVSIDLDGLGAAILI